MLHWLHYKSWRFCDVCQSFQQRKLRGVDLDRPGSEAAATGEVCATCSRRGAGRCSTPCLDEVPPSLQDLSPVGLESLTLLNLHQGKPKKHRNGCIRKDKMTQVSWKTSSVNARVALLPVLEQSKARKAKKWLLKHHKGYAGWYSAHCKFLASAAASSPGLPPSALLEHFIEVALWPRLYGKPEWCESSLKAAPSWQGPFEAKDSAGGQVMSSMKAAFTLKLQSPVLDYAANYSSYSLLQFQFDRFLLRDVMTKGRLAQEEDMSSAAHHAFDGRHWSPGQWKKHHRLLVDVVEQLGEPDLFMTIAPWEWSFPWPYWVQRAHKLLQKGPSDLPGPETLAIAHALQQLCEGFLAGKSGSNAARWRRHLCSNKADAQVPGVKAYFGRYEFQDKGLEQEFGKGRGTPHVHILFWLDVVPDLLLQHSLIASMPKEDNELREVAARVQKGSADIARAPERHHPSTCVWDAPEGRWQIQIRYGGEWQQRNLRPCFKEILRLLRCHQDVQWWHGRGALLRYVAGYAAKYGESLLTSSLDCAVSPFHAGLHVCKMWKAAAPEQVMALAREAMSFTNLSSKKYRPKAWDPPEDELLYFYRRRPVGEAEMTFLAWLRWCRVEGTFASERWALKQHRQPSFGSGF